MPWYNEEPYRFGCMATSGQKAYVDAKGNVSPCELVRMNIGNVNEEPFITIWNRFLKKCTHPVAHCIVHDINKIVPTGKKLMLHGETSTREWDTICSMEPSYVHRKLNNIENDLLTKNLIISELTEQLNEKQFVLIENQKTVEQLNQKQFQMLEKQKAIEQLQKELTQNQIEQQELGVLYQD